MIVHIHTAYQRKIIFRTNFVLLSATIAIAQSNKVNI